MATGSPITKREHTRVIKLHGEGKSRNAIAKAIGRSNAAVTKIAKAEGLTFDRTTTMQATEAARADAAKLRAQLELDYLDDAQHLRRRIRQQYLVFEWGGKDHEYAEKLITEPPPTEQYRLMQASVAAANASLRIEASRGEGGVAAARSLVSEIAGFFGYGPDGEPTDA